ncbi:hypothetical protein [Paracoccus sp. PARArs4]|uniref:hypothetical protein n=1 Tax=Paracoccus sp. PARArs4 TaxID=2853442 RepID=UPI0024A78365|nr:hypothetical protein [Paracoccus sp. PARArs4]
MIWILLAAATALALGAAIVLRRRPVATPEPVERRFAHPEELQSRIEELSGEVGPMVVPQLLRAASDDIGRNLALLEAPATEEETRRGLHSLIGILDTIGCVTLADSYRALQDDFRTGGMDEGRRNEALTETRLLRAELDALTRPEGETAGG